MTTTPTDTGRLAPMRVCTMTGCPHRTRLRSGLCDGHQVEQLIRQLRGPGFRLRPLHLPAADSFQ